MMHACFCWTAYCLCLLFDVSDVLSCRFCRKVAMRSVHILRIRLSLYFWEIPYGHRNSTPWIKTMLESNPLKSRDSEFVNWLYGCFPCKAVAQRAAASPPGAAVTPTSRPSPFAWTRTKSGRPPCYLTRKEKTSHDLSGTPRLETLYLWAWFINVSFSLFKYSW